MLAIWGGTGCSTPDTSVPDSVRTQDVAAPEPMVPLQRGMTYLEETLEVVDHRMVIAQLPYVDVTIKNRTTRQVEVECRFRYFLESGQEVFTDTSLTYVRLFFGPSEVRVLPSEPYRNGISRITMVFRWPVNREP